MALNMTLREAILMRLVEVIDPETGMDVLRMHLVRDLNVDETVGVVSYQFRPSSPLCPIAYSLASDIKQAVASIPGVLRQEIQVVDYIRAAELADIMNRDEI